MVLRGPRHAATKIESATTGSAGAVRPALEPVRGSDAPRLLNIDGISIRFGGIIALDGISFDVAKGEICGLIGPNGSGKTTLFNCLSRLYRFDRGAIGIGQTFQNLGLFRSMTVWQNVLVGGHCQTSSSFLQNALRLPLVAREETSLHARVAGLVEFLELQDVARVPVKDLPFGTQKRVELARALASAPKLL